MNFSVRVKGALALVSLVLLSRPISAQQFDWDSVTLSTTTQNGADQTFTIDDDGNYVSSAPSASAGQITNSELATLDSRIDAIKEEALEPLSCSADRYVSNAGNEISLTFANAPNAIVYQFQPSNGSTGQVCTSGDPTATQDLLDNLLELRSRYGCSPRAVWSSDATSFVLSSFNGLFARRPGDVCTERSLTYEFNVQAQTLSVYGCGISNPSSSSAHLAPIANSVQLTPNATAQIAIQMFQLQTSCPLSRCTADAPLNELTIHTGSGLPSVYHGDSYSACSTSPNPPYIADRSLTSLETFLDGLIAKACSTPGDSSTGTCASG
ncbi:MAG: hypothetical protein ACJ763_10935 [Bdellovibrionia bacterium]